MNSIKYVRKNDTNSTQDISENSDITFQLILWVSIILIKKYQTNRLQENYVHLCMSYNIDAKTSQNSSKLSLAI